MGSDVYTPDNQTLDEVVETINDKDLLAIMVFKGGADIERFKSELSSQKPIRIESPRYGYIPLSCYDDIRNMINALKTAEADARQIMSEEDAEKLFRISFEDKKLPQGISIADYEGNKGIVIAFGLGERYRFVRKDIYTKAAETLKELYSRKKTQAPPVELGQNVPEEGCDSAYDEPLIPADSGLEKGIKSSTQDSAEYDGIINSVAYVLNKVIYGPLEEKIKGKELSIAEQDAVFQLRREACNFISEHKKTFKDKPEPESDDEAIKRYVNNRKEERMAGIKEQLNARIDGLVMDELKGNGCIKSCVHKIYDIILEKDKKIDKTSKTIITQFFDPLFEYIKGELSKGQELSHNKEIEMISGIKGVKELFMKFYEITRGKDASSYYDDGKREYERIAMEKPIFAFGSSLSTDNIASILKTLMRKKPKDTTFFGGAPEV